MLESDIKQALSLHIHSRSSQKEKISLIEELRLCGGAARADVVDVAALHCYEIKSNSDSLKRLVHQGSTYMRVFDRITLVSTSKHIDAAKKVLPTSWGIILVPDSPNLELVEIRPAKKNRMSVAVQIAQLLNRKECLDLLETEGLIEGRKSYNLHNLHSYLAENFSIVKLKSFVKEALGKRVGQLAI